ncbi:MAG: hypothetical protein ACTSW1_06680 [Candidatus Hodarchaeales archaeon]
MVRSGGVKATCPNGHRVILDPIDSVFGFWMCPECKTRHYHSKWKYKVWGPQERLRRIPKEPPDYTK